MTLVALSLTITVQRIGNTTYHNAYTSYSPILNSTYTTTSSQIIYQFFIQTGVLPAGNQTCAVQFHLNNVNQTTSADTYSMTTTNLCGSTNSAPSHFWTITSIMAQQRERRSCRCEWKQRSSVQKGSKSESSQNCWSIKFASVSERRRLGLLFIFYFRWLSSCL